MTPDVTADPATLKEAWRAAAADHGFELFGVVAADELAKVPFPPNRCLDVPEGFLAGARSVIVMGMHMWDPMQNAVVTSVLPDGAIVDIARRAPTDRDQLRQIRGLHEGILRRRGRAIVEAVAEGLEAEPVPRPPRRQPATEGSDAALIVVCESLVRARASEAGLAYELLASRADLQAVINAFREETTDPDVRTLEGWRRELVGDELLELLRGRRSLRVADGLRVEIGE